MKSTQKTTLILLVLGIIFILSTIRMDIYTENQGNTNEITEMGDDKILKSPNISGFWKNFSSIHIDGNWSVAASYEWCSGNGTWTNPYIIENITMDATLSSTGSGIFINNSKNEYFIIRNCSITNAGTLAYDAGIKLENTNNGTIINCNCSDNGRLGILLINYCNNNTILDNIASNFGTTRQDFGILLRDYCDNNTISGNDANDNQNCGIDINNDCNNNTISGNIANNNNLFGIEVDFCHDNFILGNTINNNGYMGIEISGSRRNSILGNIVSNFGTTRQDYGIVLGLNYDAHNNTISGNIINDNNYYGIILDNNCDKNNFTENYLYFNVMGAILIGSGNCENSLIERNVLVSKDDKYIYDGGTGTVDSLNYKMPTMPSLCVEVTDQSFSSTEFVITINISSCLSFDPWLQSVQMWWNGSVVPSNNITELGNGLYNVSLTPKFVEPGEEPILFNMTITSANHRAKYFELYLAIESEEIEPPPPPKQLKINIINSIYTTEWFNLTLEVTNFSGDRELGANLLVTWDGIALIEPDNITDNGDGTFNLILKALLVLPGSPGIELNLTATKSGYQDGELNTEIAVDPDIIDKRPSPPAPPPSDDDDDEKPSEPDILILPLIIVGIASAIGVAGVAIFLIKKRMGVEER